MTLWMWVKAWAAAFWAGDVGHAVGVRWVRWRDARRACPSVYDGHRTVRCELDRGHAGDHEWIFDGETLWWR